METVALLLIALGGTVGIASNVVVFRSLGCKDFWRSGWFTIFLAGYVVALACFIIAMGITLPVNA